MLWGLFKKIVIADRLAIYVNVVYGRYETHSGLTLLMATIFFSFQMYCDFSGYSDIAIGAARVMGFKLMTNFNRPIFAKSTGEFWKRWHISLSTWFKDYLYFPLGGNRVPIPRLYINLFIVFVISGLWHGANWTFIVWGAINGFYLIFGLVTKKYRDKFNTMIGLDKYPALHTFIQVITVFILVCLVRVFFRAKSIQEAVFILKKIFSFSGPVWFDGTSMVVMSFTAIIILLIVELKMEYYKGNFSLFNNENRIIRKLSYAVLIIMILLFGVFDGGQFIYFQF